MIDQPYLDALQIIVALLSNTPLNWVVTGSLGMVLQGMELKVHDIDLQTDQEGAYEIEKLLVDYVVQPVQFRPSERIRSHFGLLEIEGVRVEIMGGLQKRLKDQSWEEPVQVEQWRRWVEVEGMQVPVLSLEYEYQAYLKLGRDEKARMLRNWLDTIAPSMK